MSASDTAAFGGIGIWPHTPEPPSFTFFAAWRRASLSPLYLAATSTYGRADDLLVDRVAGGAAVLLHHALRPARCRARHARRRGDSAAAASVNDASFMDSPDGRDGTRRHCDRASECYRSVAARAARSDAQLALRASRERRDRRQAMRAAAHPRDGAPAGRAPFDERRRQRRRRPRRRTRAPSGRYVVSSARCHRARFAGVAVEQHRAPAALRASASASSSVE